MKSIRLASVLLIILIVGYILYIGQNIIIPFVMAIFIWFVIREVRVYLHKTIFRKRRMSNWILNFVAASLLFAFFYFSANLIRNNIANLSSNSQLYESNINRIVLELDNKLNMDVTAKFNEWTKDVDINGIFTSILNSVSFILSQTLVMFIYLAFLFVEESGFGRKMKAIFTNHQKYEKVLQISSKIDQAIGKYLSLKSFICLMSGILTYIALEIIGIDGAGFWAFLVFLFNFIPTIGAIIATALPVLFALVQYGTLGPALWVLIAIISIQVILGNIVEPKMMGSSLNLSPLVVLLSLAFWGSLWGIIGLALCVPITVIIYILLYEMPETRPIAILLSDANQLPKETDTKSEHNSKGHH